MTEAVMTTPAAEVERARIDLRLSIDEITTIQHRAVERDDGRKLHVTAPPLLTQVEQEIVHQSAKAGSFSPRSKPPLWMDAEVFLAELDDHTGRYDGDTRAVRVRAWSAAVSSSSPGSVVDGADTAYRWRATIRHLLNPTPKFRLRGQACPNCRAEKVWDRHDEAAGENHARPALEIDPQDGVCKCLACEETWQPDYWDHLVQVLQQQREEVLAVTGYDTSVKARTAGEAGLAWHDVGDDDLPARPTRVDVHPEVIQCAARVPKVRDGQPVVDDFGQLVTQRCPALLDVHRDCPNVARHTE